MRHFQKPRAGMVICGSGPNLIPELVSSKSSTGFPNPDLFDRFAHSGHRLLNCVRIRPSFPKRREPPAVFNPVDLS
jgi:hypothetical protein